MKKIYLLFTFLILLGFLSASYDCSSINLQTYWILWSIIGLMIGVAVIVIAYMIGTLILEKRAPGWIYGRFSQFPVASTVWAKAGIFHIVISALLIVCAFGLLEFACSDAMPSIFNVSGTNMFDSAENYLEDQSELAYKTMTAFRYNMGVAEIRSSQSRWEQRSEFLIFGGGQGTSYSPHAGQRSYISIFNIGMNAGTIYLLNIYFMHYVMNYIFYGLAILFPLGIVLRSFPFVRNLGSALIALSFGLFIFFPFMLMFNAATWGEYVEANPIDEISNDIFHYSDLEKVEATKNPWHLHDKSYDPQDTIPEIPPGATPEEALEILSNHEGLPDLIPLAKLSAQSFIGAVFLPAINWIIIIILISDISKLLGQEIDARRLARMI